MAKPNKNALMKFINLLKERWAKQYGPMVKRFLKLLMERWRQEYYPKLKALFKDVKRKWKFNVVPAIHRTADAVKAKHDKGGHKGDVKARKAHNIVTHSLNARIRHIEVHPEVRDFLFNYWSRLLLKIYNRDGPSGTAWDSALKVVDDMAKYLAVEKAPGKREKMEKIYHNLEQRFRNGVRLIAVPEAVKDKFFFRLATHYQKFPAAPGQRQAKGSAAGMAGGGTPFATELLADNKPNKRQ